MFRKNTFLFGIIIFSIFIVGCRSTSADQLKVPVIQDILFHNDECSLPCWAGIQVEKTNFDDARDILEQRYGAENVVISNATLRWKSNLIDGTEGVISFANGVVYEIFLAINHQQKFTVSNLIEILGEPTWVSIAGVNDCLGVSLIYSEVGMQVALDTQHDPKGVNSSQKISTLRLIPIETAKEWIEYDVVLMNWNGYQDYCQEAFPIQTAP